MIIKNLSISTRTRHRKKFSKSNNIQNELNINEQESSENDENEQDQKSSDAEILDIESPYYEPLYQEFSDK
ncbi:hypothetical protein RhiirA1_485043 [Rhizophagus irregularis]|nr:hypothetical protein RhiirA1_485043 [Rhizophagus irregularis]